MSSLEEVRRWRAAALADGWSVEPTYKHAPVEQAANLNRDGFHVLLIARPKESKPAWMTSPKDEASLAVWGPDGLAISVDPGTGYSMAALQAGLRTCGYCMQADRDTRRVGFAGRCCSECLPAVHKRVEFPGWEN